MMEKEKNCGCAEQAAHTPDKRRHLMQQNAECEFICIDINLFLDMHPDDARALSDYNCYAEQLAALKDLYVKNYGPLSNFGRVEMGARGLALALWSLWQGGIIDVDL